MAQVPPGPWTEIITSAGGRHGRRTRPNPPMSRVIVDAAGVAWEVWEVHPTAVEHRSDAGESPPTTGERRRAHSARIKLSAGMQEGWLAIRSDAERRRVAPIPPGWDELDDAQLLALVEGAKNVGAPRRLIE